MAQVVEYILVERVYLDRLGANITAYGLDAVARKLTLIEYALYAVTACTIYHLCNAFYTRLLAIVLESHLL